MPSTQLQTALFMLNRPEPIRQASLLMVLASGVGHGDTLLEGLAAHANECRSPWADRVHSLRLLLEQGLPLSAALAANPNLLPEHAVHAIRVGETTGTLREVLQDEASRLTLSLNNTPSPGIDPANALLWLNTVGVILLCIVSFLMMFIIPKFKRIFEDFGTELPQMTRALISMADQAGELLIVILPAMTSLLIGGTVFSVWAAWKRLSSGHVVFSEHWPRYWVPDVLRLLSISVAAGQPVAATLHSILQELTPGAAARVFSRLRHRVDHGEDCFLTMQELGLLGIRETHFLHAASRSGHLDWGLHHLSMELEQRRFRWIRRLMYAMQPAIILLVGALVFFVVVGMFLPVVKLINDLS